MQTGMQTDTSSGEETDVRQKAEETASTLVSQAQEVASSQVSTHKERAASTLDSVADSIRRAGSEMRDDQPQLASLTDQAATRMTDVSNYLREHELRDFVREAEDFARREPLLFLGGAFAVGFLAARFLKASSPNRGARDGWRQGGGDDRRYGSLSGGTGSMRGLGEGYGTTGYGSRGYAATAYGATAYGSGGYASGGLGVREDASAAGYPDTGGMTSAASDFGGETRRSAGEESNGESDDTRGR